MPRRKVLKNYVRDLVINWLVASALIPTPLRARSMRLLRFAEIGRCWIAPGCFFGSTRVSIGTRTSISRGCFFDGLDYVRIGADCDIAMEVLFVTSSHKMGPASRRAGRPTSAPVTVGDGVWIGARATLLPGVTIGNGCVIAAGSVVTSDCDANHLYAGVPARLVKAL